MAQQLKPYLDASGRLAIWPAKHSRRLLALGHLASQLDRGRIYTESDLGYELLLLQTCRDAATIRRELFDAGLIDRCPDGSRYWVVDLDDSIALAGIGLQQALCVGTMPPAHEIRITE